MLHLRLNARQFVVAIIFVFAQIIASATIYDHMGDPLHTADDCTLCTTASTDTDGALPPLEAMVAYPVSVTEGVTLQPASVVLAPCPKANRARAPPHAS